LYAVNKNNKVSLNKSAIAAVGEGAAGYLAQQVYKCSILARPNHDYPDIVMEANGETFLVEAKSSITEKNLDSTIKKELQKLASYGSAAQQRDVRTVRALLVGTFIKSEDKYECKMIELELA
jgi:hypothetical protein